MGSSTRAAMDPMANNPCMILKYKSSAVAEMGDHLATLDMGRKVVGAAVPLSVGELGLHLTQCRLGRGIAPYQVAS